MKFIPYFILMIFSATIIDAAPVPDAQEWNVKSEIQSIQETIQLNRMEFSKQQDLLLRQKELTGNLVESVSSIKGELSTELGSLKLLSDNSRKKIIAINKKVEKNQKQLSSFATLLDQQTKSLGTLEKSFTEHRKEVNEILLQQSQRTEELEKALVETQKNFNRLIEDVNGGVAETKNKINILGQDMGSKVKNLSYWLALVAVIGGIGIAIGVFVRKKLSKSSDQLGADLTRVRLKMEEENIQIDSKLVELLQGQMKLIQEQPGLSSATSIPAEIDHSLQLKVGEEIFRMKLRLSGMPNDIKGLKPLMKSLERLEDEFNQKGYELVEMLGKPFDDGINANVRFIPSDDLSPAEQIVNKIIKPQINFHGVAIQIADIEVITGE